MNRILHSFYQSLNVFLAYVPEMIGALVVFLIALILARWISKLGAKYSMHRSKDKLISTFAARLIYAIIFIIGIVIALGILGLGGVSNKILAGAGITTFVIGFALKDIG